jgi:ABC-type nitrate/sulfonate/bicarbonate transport system substrate-binding protein
MTKGSKTSIAGPTTDHDEIRRWAAKHNAVPTEILPQHLNHEPMVLRMMLPQMAADRIDIRVLTWEEFFAKFDLLGLTFVYDSNSGGYNELLQIDSRNPYRSSRDQPIDPHN